MSAFPDIPGFDFHGLLTDGKDLKLLQGLAQESRDILEVGCWAGLSAFAMTLANPEARIFCVDNWSGGDILDDMIVHKGRSVFETFMANMQPYLFTRIFPCFGNSLDWAKVWTIPLDMAYIDGAHDYMAVRDDLRAWKQHVKPGGVLVAHDYGFYPGVTRAVDEELAGAKIERTVAVWRKPT